MTKGRLRVAWCMLHQWIAPQARRDTQHAPLIPPVPERVAIARLCAPAHVKPARAVGLGLLIALVAMLAPACSGDDKQPETAPASGFPSAQAGAQVTVGACSVGPLA